MNISRKNAALGGICSIVLNPPTTFDELAAKLAVPSVMVDITDLESVSICFVKGMDPKLEVFDATNNTENCRVLWIGMSIYKYDVVPELPTPA